MADNIKELQETSPSPPPISPQDATIEEAMMRLRICPRKVLASLGHLRIEKARIKPLEDKPPKAGGKADVEAAILAPVQSSNSLGSKDTEYVAVKKLRFGASTDNDKVIAPFAHEVKLLNDLSHSNVVKIVGFVEDVEQGIAWMVFSWEGNGNLREFVRSASWELPERVSLIGDVAMGLRYLHGRTSPICHGDLKSLNVLVNSENRAIITDFGSARTMDSASAPTARSARSAAMQFQHQITTTAPIVESLKAELDVSGDFITMTGPAWTVRWAAPELLEGELAGLASDIWALGWICWEAITGNFPFNEENDLAIVLRITKGDLPAVGDDAQLKQVKELCSLMGRCWRLNGNERPTAMRCQQELSFMHQVVPSSNKLSGSAPTRSSALLRALGWIQLRNGILSEAEKYFQESFAVAKSAGDKPGQARALYSLGYMYSTQSERSKAEESYTQARDTYSEIGDQEGFADSVWGLGEVYRLQNESSKAEELYNQIRNTYSQLGNQHGISYSFMGLGDVYQMRSEYSKAEESYIQARDTSSQIGDQLGFANAVQGLGGVFSALGNYAEAEKSYLEAQAVYRQLGDVLSLANNLWYLGWLRRNQAQYGEAERFVCEASTLYGNLGVKSDVTACDEFIIEVQQLRAS